MATTVVSAEDSSVNDSAKSNCVVARLLDHDNPATDLSASGVKPFCTLLELAVNTAQFYSQSLVLNTKILN